MATLSAAVTSTTDGTLAAAEGGLAAVQAAQLEQAAAARAAAEGARVALEAACGQLAASLQLQREHIDAFAERQRIACASALAATRRAGAAARAGLVRAGEIAEGCRSTAVDTISSQVLHSAIYFLATGIEENAQYSSNYIKCLFGLPQNTTLLLSSLHGNKWSVSRDQKTRSNFVA